MDNGMTENTVDCCCIWLGDSVGEEVVRKMVVVVAGNTAAVADVRLWKRKSHGDGYLLELVVVGDDGDGTGVGKGKN